VLAYVDAVLGSRASAGWVLEYAIEQKNMLGPVLGQIPRTRMGAWESAWVTINPYLLNQTILGSTTKHINIFLFFSFTIQSDPTI
jgi:hypothetical protein